MTQPIGAFRPVDQGTVSLAVTTTTGSVALTAGSLEYLIVNEGSASAFIRFGASGVTATLPSGATGGSTPIAAGVVAVIRGPVTSPTHVAAITASGTATLYITPGAGH